VPLTNAVEIIDPDLRAWIELRRARTLTKAFDPSPRGGGLADIRSALVTLAPFGSAERQRLPLRRLLRLLVVRALTGLVGKPTYAPLMARRRRSTLNANPTATALAGALIASGRKPAETDERPRLVAAVSLLPDADRPPWRPPLRPRPPAAGPNRRPAGT
jgi:hypothetical protein